MSERPFPTIWAIDPGNIDSGLAILDAATREPRLAEKLPNEELHDLIWRSFDSSADRASTRVVIEMIASYGMAVGREVFETCVWIGRFQEALLSQEVSVELVFRREVKLHHCHATKAKDSNVIQALVDRFTPGEKNFGKGTKASPGFFYGFKKDVWQAYALGVYEADRLEGLQ